jgi:nitric oxide reductase subunit C
VGVWFGHVLGEHYGAELTPGEEEGIMTKKQAKAFFIWSTAASALVFFGLTFDSLRKLPSRTHQEKLDEGIAQGKWTWQKHNCNDCHTILGIGGYYAPDVTRVMSRRDPDWAGRFLKNPAAVWPAKRKMPDLHLSDREIADLVAFLTWVNGIDTNNWPPQPLAAAAQPVSAPASVQAGRQVFQAQGCSACHAIKGVGGSIGPDLTHIGAQRDKNWLKQQILDPQSHFPNSPMPSFSRLSPKDLSDLVDYLSSLK